MTRELSNGKHIKERAATAVGALVVAYLVALSPLVGTAVAGNAEDARAYVEKATTAYALSRYASAAENYEKAYELAPEPAILYNAAQAHRLAGNKQRALELYQSYARVYGNEKREEIDKHIADLKKAIDHDKEVATSPPTTTEPTKEAPKTNTDVTNAPPPKIETNGPVLVSRPENRPAERPLTSNPWFWGAVGGGVVVAAVVVLLLVVGGDGAASANMGRVAGN